MRHKPVPKPVICLWLPRFSTVVSYRPYNVPVGPNVTLGSWVCQRLSRQILGGALYLPAFTETDERLLRFSVPSPDPSLGEIIRMAPRDSYLSQLLDVMAAVGVDTLVAVPMGAALMPQSALASVWTQHQHAAADCTVVVQGGLGFETVVINESCLRTLSGVGGSEQVKDLASIAQVLASLAHGGACEALPLRIQSIPASAVWECTLDPARELTWLKREQIEAVGRVCADKESLAINADECLYPEWLATLESLERSRASQLAAWRPVNKLSRLSTDKPKTLFVTRSTGFAGGDRLLIDLVSGLGKRGWRTGLMLRFPGVLSGMAASAGAEVFECYESFTEPTVANVIVCRQLLDKWQPSLVHLNGFVGLPLLCAALEFDIPIVQHVRLASVSLLRDQLLVADGVIAASQFIADSCRRAGVQDARLYTVYDGFDPAFLRSAGEDRTRTRARYGLKADDWVVLMVARFDPPTKRHDVLLRAIEQLVADVPMIRLVLVGEPALNPDGYDSVRQLIAESDLTQRVTFVDFEADLRPLEAAVDAIVLCSDGEGLGACLCEGMAIGVPVVAAGSGGFPELISDSQNGILCAGSSDSVATALRTLYFGGEFVQRMVERARETIEARFSMPRYIEQVSEIYERVRRAPPTMPVVRDPLDVVRAS
jgi:glycosyltransferase involved in cell wall biosynthesis